MRKAIGLSLIGLFLMLGGCLKEDDDDLAGLIAQQAQQPVTTFSALSFASGLGGDGFTTSSSQTVSGNLSNAAANLIMNGAFSGSARLFVNSTAYDLSVNPSGSYSQPITLMAGPNQIWIETYDSLGQLNSRSATTTVTYAAGGSLTVSLASPDLSAFPTVSLNLTVSDGGSAVTGLTAANFNLINAGKRMNLTGFSQLGGGQYRLSYRDVTCGKREIYAYVTNGSDFGSSALSTYGQSYALIVGINDYANCPGNVSNLSNCVNDANDVRAALLTAPMWDAANSTGDDIDDDAVHDAITAIRTAMNPEDLFVFFYSSHGSGNSAAGAGSQYLVTNAATTADWISVADLDSWLKNVFPDPNAGTGAGLANIVVLLDACYSGNFIGAANALLGMPTATLKYAPWPGKATAAEEAEETFAKSLNTATNICALTAATGNEYSWDVPSLQNGAFTYYLTKALGYGHGGANKAIGLAPGNANQDVWLSIQDEIYAYVLDLAGAYNQHARCCDNDADATTVCRLLSSW